MRNQRKSRKKAHWLYLQTRSKTLLFLAFCLSPLLAQGPGEVSAPQTLPQFEFINIPAGSFMRGTDFGGDEGPRRQVTISKPFELGKYEVTQEQWQAVMGQNPKFGKCPRCPAEEVSWSDAQKFIAKLNEPDAGHTYRLPTEAEWEYAARAGATTDYVKSYDELAWYVGNSGVIVKQEALNIKAHPVGTKKPNAWGLYDMHGNAAEWCQDWYQSNYYELSPAVDPPGPATGRVRVYRGGSYGSFPNTLRAAYRNGGNSDTNYHQTGVRLVRETRR